jgi:hypothetical protein
MRARVPLVIAATAAVAVALVTPFIVADADETGSAKALAHRLGLQTTKKDVGAAKGATNALVTSKGANPYMALKPGAANADWAYWKEVMNLQGAQRAEAQGDDINIPEDADDNGSVNVGDEVILEEQEPAGERDNNDSLETAEAIDNFDTQGGNDIVEATLQGDMATPNPPEKAGPFEDNNELGAAADIGEIGDQEGIETNGDIGDDGAGDFYLMRDVEAGDVLTAITNTPDSELDTVAVLFDTAGTAISAADDQNANPDTRLSAVAPKDGDFVVGIFGFNEQTAGLPEDVNDADSAVAGSNGAYIATFGRNREDTDFFSVDMQKGDVLGGSLSGQGTQMAIFDDENRQLIGSTLDLSAIASDQSPLPGGGNAVLSFVAPKTGTFNVMVTGGRGAYENEMVLSRPGSELNGSVQKVFLDFDGAQVDVGEFGVEGGGNRDLSGLDSFLGRWDLDANQENELIQKITDTVTENLEEAAEQNGTQVEVLNSLQDGEQFGQADVSRVVIGGTVEESGIETIGISQSNDTGNFDSEESAMVLLDILSGSEDDPNSLNFYLNDESDRVDFIGSRIGDVASHEAGHFFGNFHVDPFNDTEDLMDAGGNPEQFFGPGNDGIGGTGDDEDKAFGEDVYAQNEGFSGIEDTQATTGFAFSADAAAAQAEQNDAQAADDNAADDQGAADQGEAAGQAEGDNAEGADQGGEAGQESEQQQKTHRWTN